MVMDNLTSDRNPKSPIAQALILEALYAAMVGQEDMDGFQPGPRLITLAERAADYLEAKGYRIIWWGN